LSEIEQSAAELQRVQYLTHG